MQHVFDKVDSNKDLHINRMVGLMLCYLWTCVRRSACRGCG
jgi:hypothetical protein